MRKTGTALLLSCELAMSVPDVPVPAVDRIRSIDNLARELRLRLQVNRSAQRAPKGCAEGGLRQARESSNRVRKVNARDKPGAEAADGCEDDRGRMRNRRRG